MIRERRYSFSEKGNFWFDEEQPEYRTNRSQSEQNNIYRKEIKNRRRSIALDAFSIEEASLGRQRYLTPKKLQFQEDWIVRKLSFEDKKETVDRMVDFFQWTDPLWMLAQPDEKKRFHLLRESFVPKWITLMLKSGKMFGLFQGRILMGVCSAFGPEDKYTTFKKVLDNPVRMGISVFNRYSKNLKKCSKIYQGIMQDIPHWRIIHPAPHYYEENGALLLKKIIEMADSDNKPIYLEVFKEEHMQFYLPYGFECKTEFFLNRDSGIEFKYFALVKLPKTEENITGTFLSKECIDTTFHSPLKDIPVEVPTWERNILSLEKGEWGSDMDQDAFRKYLKNRKSIPSFGGVKVLPTFEDMHQLAV